MGFRVWGAGVRLSGFGVQWVCMVQALRLRELVVQGTSSLQGGVIVEGFGSEALVGLEVRAEA